MTSLNTSTSALDFAQIAQLKSNAKLTNRAALKNCAAVRVNFYQHDAAVHAQGYRTLWLMDSDAAQTYESMFDQELALHLSEQGGFGVAEALNGRYK